jgi:DNA-nicking Smr family endonuclease
VSRKKDRRRGRDEPDDSELFESALGDVEPLGGPRRVVPRPGRRRGRRAARGRLRAERVRFSVERIGNRVAGLAPGADAEDLARLRAGEVPPDFIVDLHGFDELEARGMVRDTLRRARRSDLRCVKVIHGRGVGSGGDPVLKEALPGWLEEPPLGSWIAAFASSPSRHGGPGSTLVLLWE